MFQILNLYQNNIKRLENMDRLKKLAIFSIGQNQIQDRMEAVSAFISISHS